MQHGFAYGLKGKNLVGKQVISIISTGGDKEVYCKEGRNHFTINEFLVPFKQSVNLCGMEYLPPFVIYGSYSLNNTEIEQLNLKYKKLLFGLRDGQWENNILNSKQYFNDILD